MLRVSALALITSALASATPAAHAATYGFVLQASVQPHCEVEYRPGGPATGDGLVTLGELNEFCNAPSGYELVVSYTPGTLRGAVIAVGDDQVVLNGSGQAVLSRTNGPKIRARTLSAAPGANGFDTDRLDFRLQPV